LTQNALDSCGIALCHIQQHGAGSNGEMARVAWVRVILSMQNFKSCICSTVRIAASLRRNRPSSQPTHARSAGCRQLAANCARPSAGGHRLSSPRHACTRRANAPPSALRGANERHQQPCARAEDRRISAAEVGSLTGVRSRLLTSSPHVDVASTQTDRVDPGGAQHLLFAG
jgi:hypothetical protein